MRKRGTILDVIIDVPYLWLNDGYGQSAPLVIKLLGEVLDKHGFTWGILKTPVISRLTEYDTSIRQLTSKFVNRGDIAAAKLLFRYHYPNEDKLTADKLVSYTMFETDAVPSGWIDVLNKSDLVIVPNDYLLDVFSSTLETQVGLVYIPLHDIYYQMFTEEALTEHLGKTFVFNFVGTLGDVDRKSAKQLVNQFNKISMNRDMSLLVKGRGIGPAMGGKIKPITGHISITNMAAIYLSAHAGVYPSKGEGYGMPQLETSLLGRPLIVALNSASLWSVPKMPWVESLQCEPGPAVYTHKSIQEPGNWGYCDSKELSEKMIELYNLWNEDKDAYKHKIYLSHKDNKLRNLISYRSIKKQMEKTVVPLLTEEVNES